MEDATGEIHHSGHAIECRINARIGDVCTSAGRITTFQAPGGTAYAWIPPLMPTPSFSVLRFDDCKLIVKGRDRSEAIAA